MSHALPLLSPAALRACFSPVTCLARLARLARSARAVAALVAAVLAGAALTGCYSGPDRTKALVRLVNASTYASLDLRVGDVVQQSAVDYGGNAAYVDVDPGLTQASVNAAGSATALTSFTPSFTRRKHATVLAYGNAGALQQLTLDDEHDAPASGRTAMRVVNAAADAGALDVYLTGASDVLTSAVPTSSAVAFGTPSAWTEVASGSWRLRITGAGVKEDLRLDLSGFSLGSADVITLVLTPSRSGVLVSALVLAQQGGVVRQDVSLARVRLLSGMAGGGAVTATLGTVVMGTDQTSPALSSYQVVNAGTPALALSVDSQSVGAPNTTLLPGGDYTLMVYGTAVLPAAAWLSDTNALPSTGKTRVRLVNAAYDISAAGMKVAFEAVASGVAPGAASTYAEVAPIAAGTVSITAAGSNLVDLIDQQLLANAGYSVFVVGALDGTQVIVRRDR